MERTTGTSATTANICITTASSPTTFVQADAHTFKELVQKLTGANDDSQEKLPVTVPARLANRANNAAAAPGDVGPRRPAFKLHERRQGLRKLDIKLGVAALRPPHPSPRSQQLLLSPTTAFSDLSLSSPVTPLDPFENGFYSPNSGYFRRIASPSSGSESSSSPPGPAATMSEEEKAIAEKGFYLHPSPINTPRGAEPELLPLFPLQSPRQSPSSSFLASYVPN
ncbi:unnamed protein product [Victoria cruziana]